MPTLARTASLPRWSIAFLLLLSLLVALWIAGGASQPDVLGQAVARLCAWLTLVAAIVLGARPAVIARPVLLLLTASVLLTLLQLVPLPPQIWQSLPGRAVFTEAVSDSPWRPWAIVPSATFNAASSLIVPVAILLLMSALGESERRWLPGILLGLVLASTLVGLLQFSGVRFDHPLVNDSVGAVSGTFANRNHFALFVAFGCLLAPVWALADGRKPRWRGPIAIGLVLLFALTILASGSRAGMLVGGLALAVGLALSWYGIQRELRRAPRWVFPAIIAAIVSMVAIFVVISVAADRAESINRVLALDPGEDMRRRGFPTVIAMVKAYFPVGTGFGSFDPMFRLHEPFSLLKRTYFNHAHNDFLEIILDGGLPALLLLGAALVWWAVASVKVWIAGSSSQFLVSRAGSAMLFLVFVASVVDYPARTPMMMAVIVIAAVWLSRGATTASHATRPSSS